MDSDYDLKNFILTHIQLSTLKDYYESWSYQGPINLKFRYLNVFGYFSEDNKPRWLNLQKFVNRRRIRNEELQSVIMNLFDSSFVPIRIFHSAAEWLNPHELKHQSNSLYLIRNGITVLENDDSLQSSYQAAMELNSLVTENKLFVYSGNKSIHTWLIDVQINDFLDVPDNVLYRRKNREKLDRKLRKQILKKYQQNISLEFDHRAAEDSRRVLPIIGTVNAFTGRVVTQIPQSTLSNLDLNEMIDNVQLKGW